MTDKVLKHAKDNSRIILITYGYGSEALSIPKMDAIILASPRKAKIRQTLGRILRMGGNYESERMVKLSFLACFRICIILLGNTASCC